MDKSQGISYIYGGPSHSIIGRDHSNIVDKSANMDRSSFLSVPTKRRGSSRKEPKLIVTPVKGVLDGLNRRRSIMSKGSSLRSVSEVEEGLGDLDDDNTFRSKHSGRSRGMYPPTLAIVDAAKFTNEGGGSGRH